jgi:hypothetical protein
MTVEKALAEKHYADLSSKPFFAGLVEYICSGPVVAMVGGPACPHTCNLLPVAGVDAPGKRMPEAAAAAA